ncbi:ankyrin repeat protein [Lentzea atacamensis]|uniref:Ankyrin repeat protein n=1 Tax=Lentzea atacamensis TaxID=531938 RepID=A0ABX9E1W4_9PSEU|nr:ankyrin repeat domain-containing protein [Lentzea atacamensis]RAS62513.1 ankyrin repeat protein [Lentzea atacamensis]
MTDGWRGFPSTGWQSANAVRRRLDAGADPDGGVHGTTPLHLAVEHGTAEAVEELAARARHVDAINRGRTPLWQAVQEGKPGLARVLLAAGADPSRPMMSGWSPARLSLATDHVIPSGEVLNEQEQAAVDVRDGLLAAEEGFPHYDNYTVVCVADIDAAEAIRRLNAAVVPAAEVPDTVPAGDWFPAPFGEDTDFTLSVTGVPGGCVLVQPWHFNLQLSEFMERLSAGTVAYGMYANPSSGKQGCVYRNGRAVDGDLHPGGGPNEHTDTDAYLVLLAHLYEDHAVAYCCAFAGVRPPDNKAFTEPDQWIRLPGLSNGRA